MPQVPVYGPWLVCIRFESDNNKQPLNSIKLKFLFARKVIYVDYSQQCPCVHFF